MLKYVKEKIDKNHWLKANYGIEREVLRVNGNGELALSNHPAIFGDKINNPYITTDFSESQIEMITPVFDNVEDVYKFMNSLYDIVTEEIGDEYLWPQSMTCLIYDENKIPIAKYNKNKKGKEAEEYRKKLIEKYGKKKQLISGIHYNFSFNERLIKKLYKQLKKEKESYESFKNNIYLKITRNYLRYRWLIIYLLGASPVLHDTYISNNNYEFEEISHKTFSNNKAVSYRNGKNGYRNKIDFLPNYNSVEEYVESLKNFISEGVIDSHKELYSQIRLKPKNNENFFDSLLNDGINYLEYRSIDINPFEKSGISLDDLYFIQVFNIYLLLKEESSYMEWQKEALENQNIISNFGQENVQLKKDGKCISRNDWALEILKDINNINDELNLERKDAVDLMIKKVKNTELTYSYRILKKIKEEGYVKGFLSLSKEYKENAYNNRFKFEVYEDLELSTQILIKEAIKRGIKFSIIDRNDNFISLEKDKKIEYIKQATKTSKDNYSSVLIMENKVVTKKVLENNNINVPKGNEFISLDEAISMMDEFIDKPIVVKPKSTNFGIGISIFTEKYGKEDLVSALKMAFKHDTTVLVEEFIKGKEYRFLVINDEVVGVLHRVPANVVGDGVNNINTLVKIKNQDPLRGYHYRTPLEKINLDENAKLFLKQQNKDFTYVPKKDEVVYLRENSNISTGGDSIDYTDDIPEIFKNIAVKSVKAVNAKICGVDMILEDYKDENSLYAIIELNFNPAIHIHSYPYKGIERKIAEKILKLLEFI
ncbi:bifunctional glutamate--cysteine ligase GshA/glutathione synthetase GshB [Clostridium taeniosporum]|uniref:Glutathione biosynthesis bifunctional protein GshAB n=1 Tax=Clostridium taeniosporum TaxID=394958 RepID=A0A1D7XJI3_9CLOT|nr:bifunctional glutamate--cysteine ligase GshA/glutathione synthetase GshB [Clostridium taeniosporum]AOR23508.1 bifunctional glutamate--cysteine ligase/glutathione synthetase [Clostridium taeniosporum]